MPKPVLFVPGLPGSHLYHEGVAGDRDRIFFDFWKLFPQPDPTTLERLEGPDDLAAADPVSAGEPIKRLARFLFFDLAKQAESLYGLLRRIGAEAVGFGWDWRRPVWDASLQARLRQAIVDLAATSGQPVVVIVHSTGGLVIRELVETGDAALLDAIERIVAFGVPWAGTLKPLELLTARKGFFPLSEGQAQRLLAHSWAAFDLQPPDPAKTVMSDHRGRPLGLVLDGDGAQASTLIERDWYPAALRPAMEARAAAADARLGTRTPALRLPPGRVLPVTNVVGWGGRTTTRALITGSGAQQAVELMAGSGDATLDGGDETVPRVSAAWLRGPGVVTHHLPVGLDPGFDKSPHSVLWKNDGGRALLRHVVGGEPLAPFVYGAVDDADTFSGQLVRLRLVALAADGSPLAASVRARGLRPPELPAEPFDPDFEGRHLLRIPRAQIPTVHDGRLRRFEVEVEWPGGSKRMAFVVWA